MIDYWEENNIIKPTRVVVCAACRFNTFIICGVRHWDKLMHTHFSQLKITYPHLKAINFEEGFIDQFGDFLSREEALMVIKESKQSFNSERNQSTKILYSEGLY